MISLDFLLIYWTQENTYAKESMNFGEAAVLLSEIEVIIPCESAEEFIEVSGPP